MKKIFTAFAIAVLASAGADAASFLTVKVDGTEVKNGDVVVSNKLDTEEYEGEVFFWELKPDFTIGASSLADYSLTITNAGQTVFQYCGVAGASTNTMLCQQLAAGASWTDKGVLDPGKNYSVTYDYQHMDLENIPEKVECYAHFKLEAESDDGFETLEFDVNLIYPGGDAVESISDNGLTLVVGNGRVAAANGADVEVYSLSGARVANEGLKGLYVVRAGGKASKVVVK